MRRIVSILSFGSAICISSVSFAQGRPVVGRPPASARPAVGRPVQPQPVYQQQQPVAVGRPPQNDNSRMCNSQRALMTQDEQRLAQQQADVARADAELAQLRRRMDELQRERAEDAREADMLRQRLAGSKQNYDRQCANSDNCNQFQAAAQSLDQRGDQLEKRLSDVTNDTQQSRRDTDGLERRIEPLRNEYRQRQCNNLVPGETAQETIDRCSSLFSEWNRLQSDLNRENQRLASLKTRYEELFSELRNIEERQQDYTRQAAAQCRAQPQYRPNNGRNYADVRKRAEVMGRELDGLISTVSRLRGVRISLETK